MAAEKDFYTLQEIAERWGCSHSTVLTHVYDGTLRAVDISTNPGRRSRYIVAREAVEAFEESRVMPVLETTPVKRRRVRVPADAVIEFFE